MRANGSRECAPGSRILNNQGPGIVIARRALGPTRNIEKITWDGWRVRLEHALEQPRAKPVRDPGKVFDLTLPLVIQLSAGTSLSVKVAQNNATAQTLTLIGRLVKLG